MTQFLIGFVNLTNIWIWITIIPELKHILLELFLNECFSASFGLIFMPRRITIYFFWQKIPVPWMILYYDQQLYQKKKKLMERKTQNSHFSNSWPTKSPFYRTNFVLFYVICYAIILYALRRYSLLLTAHTTIFVVILLLCMLCLEEFAASRLLVGCHQANCQQWTDYKNSICIQRKLKWLVAT